MEMVQSDSLSYPSSSGFHQLSIRVRDEDNSWGPAFKRAVYISSIQDLKITAAEFSLELPILEKVAEVHY